MERKDLREAAVAVPVVCIEALVSNTAVSLRGEVGLLVESGDSAEDLFLGGVFPLLGGGVGDVAVATGLALAPFFLGEGDVETAAVAALLALQPMMK